MRNSEKPSDGMTYFPFGQPSNFSFPTGVPPCPSLFWIKTELRLFLPNRKLMKSYSFILYLTVLCLLFTACQKEDLEDLTQTETEAYPEVMAEADDTGIETLLANMAPRTNKTMSLSDVTLTPHFQSWLSANGYGSYNFSNPNIDGDSYGGKPSANSPVNQQPVIFIHGNSDKAVGSIGTTQSGWTGSINHFTSQGYTEAELYAITWGDANPLLSANQTHSKPVLTRLRAFVEAVIAYTGAQKVDIVTHSMGVTLMRKVIEGGTTYDPNNGGYYNLGPSLSASVDGFVGIAGANKGLTNCYPYPSYLTPTCDDETGLYPGYLWWGFVTGVSDILYDINTTSGYEGDYRYSIWSPNDVIVGYGCQVYGSNTCHIPGQTGSKSEPLRGHFGLKDYTGSVQYGMVVNHVIN